MRRQTLGRLTGYAGVVPAIVLLLLILSPGSSHGLNLTYADHIFDLKHNFSQPSDVAVSEDGRIYVVDGVNHSVKVFRDDGSYAYSFGRQGSLRGQFSYPLGIDISDSGRIYIADSGNQRVQIFTPEGKFIGQIRIDGDLAKADPSDVAVNEAMNRIYIADNDNHRILVYSIDDFRLLSTFGKPGETDREFRYPFLMAHDTSGYLYISDVVNTRVQSYNPEGLFVTTIGGWGVEKGQFFRPKGVTTDQEKRIYVSDSYMGVIQIFNDRGDFLSAIGDAQTGALKKFTTPVGIFVDNKKRLYVVEMFAEKVSVYALQGMVR